MHVFGETKRVMDFMATCQAESMDEEQRIVKLGQLMNESH